MPILIWRIPIITLMLVHWIIMKKVVMKKVKEDQGVSRQH